MLACNKIVHRLWQTARRFFGRRKAGVLVAAPNPQLPTLYPVFRQLAAGCGSRRQRRLPKNIQQVGSRHGKRTIHSSVAKISTSRIVYVLQRVQVGPWKASRAKLADPIFDCLELHADSMG